MLKKLLKYDLKYMIKSYYIFYILAIFFAILTRLLFSLEQTVIIKILGQVSIGCMFSVLANILINTVIRCWVNFRDSVYKDEAYLTHTLPVTKNQIYNSKLLNSLIIFIISFLVIIVSLVITYYSKENYLLLQQIIEGLSVNLNLSTVYLFVGILFLLFLEIFNVIQCGFLGVITGYRFNNNKLLLSFIFGFVAYIFTEIFIVFSLFITSVFNKKILALFSNSIKINVEIFKFLIPFSIMVYLVAVIIIIIISKIIFNKGVNVE